MRDVRIEADQDGIRDHPALGQPEVGVQDPEDEQPGSGKERDLGGQLRRKDSLELEFLEPQPIGIESDKSRNGEEQDENCAKDDDGSPADVERHGFVRS